MENQQPCNLEHIRAEQGLAKTLMIRLLAEAMNLGFRRIQFKPDLMSADIIGIGHCV